VNNNFLKDYLQEKQGTEDVAMTGGVLGHEVPVHGEFTLSQEVSREEVAPLLSGRGSYGQ